MEDLHSKLNNRVKIVSLTQVSNVTGQIFDLQKVSELLDTQYSQDLDFPQSLITGKRPLFIVDGSQSVPHFQIDVEKI
jgi:selenocysteine lyase/cysteine desulfurase